MLLPHGLMVLHVCMRDTLNLICYHTLWDCGTVVVVIIIRAVIFGHTFLLLKKFHNHLLPLLIPRTLYHTKAQHTQNLPSR